MTRLRLAVAIFGACAWLSGSLAAQRDSSGLAGTVYSAYTGLPLGAVLVSLPGARVFTTTDSAGRFVLRPVPAGEQQLRVVYRDRIEAIQNITLPAGRTLYVTVVINVDAVALPAIEVRATGAMSRYSLSGFYERRRLGFGTFYTYEDLERRGALALRNLLAEAGLDVRCTTRGCTVLSLRAGRYCAVPIYVDGWPVTADELNRIRADQLAGVEVYRRGLGAPSEYRRGSDDCGAVLVWSRY